MPAIEEDHCAPMMQRTFKCVQVIFIVDQFFFTSGVYGVEITHTVTLFILTARLSIFISPIIEEFSFLLFTCLCTSFDTRFVTFLGTVSVAICCYSDLLES